MPITATRAIAVAILLASMLSYDYVSLPGKGFAKLPGNALRKYCFQFFVVGRDPGRIPIRSVYQPGSVPAGTHCRFFPA